MNTGTITLSGDLDNAKPISSVVVPGSTTASDLPIVSDAAIVNAIRNLQNNPNVDACDLAVIESALNERDILLATVEQALVESVEEECDSRAALTENLAKWMCWSDRASYIFHTGKFARDANNYWIAHAAPNLKQKWRNLATALLAGGADSIVDTAAPTGAPSMPGMPR